MSKTIRSVILFAAPLLVGLVNIFHPINHPPVPIYETVHSVAIWWITLHVINLFGFALVGLAAYLFILDRHGLAATIAKAALIVFVPAYTGFDAIIGIGTGNLVRYALTLPVGQLAGFIPAIQAYWNNQVATMLAIVGSIGWTVAMGATAVSFAASRRGAAVAIAVLAGPFTGWGYSSGAFGTLPWWIGVAVFALVSLILVRPALPFTLLILSAVLFGTSHVVPFGPLGMACFVLAAAVTQFVPRPSETRVIAAARS